MRVTVLAGGWSSEREISLKSGRAIENALKENGHECSFFDLNQSNISDLMTLNTDLVFIALHGNPGEDGSIQGLLDLAGIPYTGSGPLASGLALDKAQCKRLATAENIPTPEYVVIEKGDKDILGKIQERLSSPWIIKPSTEGSSLGITIAANIEEMSTALNEALRHSTVVVIERCIKGTEITISLTGNQHPLPLPIIQIQPHAAFFDFRTKYTKGETNYLVPAPLDESIAQRARDLSIRVHCLIHCRGFSRVDFIIDQDNVPQFLEINTIPGFTETSLLPMAAAKQGINFNELIEKIITDARKEETI